MPYEDEGRVRQIGSADLLVGIPTFRNAGTVGHVLRAVEVGLRKYFPSARAVIVVSDGGSEDGTRDVVTSSALGSAEAEQLLVDPSSATPERVLLTYGGPSGKGSAFRAIFEVAETLRPKACAVLDADLRSVSPEWVDRLLSPVLLGHDHVTPVYTRHKFDGTITNSIAFPLTAALYGRLVRQPIGGDFGFSTQLASTWAAQDVWSTDVARFGVDIWMTTFALVSGATVCQTHLGAKIHDPKDPGSDLGPMFRQVVGSLFALAVEHPQGWVDVDDVAAVPTFGFPTTMTAESLKVSPDRLAWQFAHARSRMHATWRRVLSPAVYEQICTAADRADAGAIDVLPPELWVRVVYDALVTFSRGELDAGDLLDSLVPLYLARTATFVADNVDADADTAERAVLSYAQAFLQDKDYLRAQWFSTGLRRRLSEHPMAADGTDHSGRDEPELG